MFTNILEKLKLREKPELEVLLKYYRNNLSEILFKRFQYLYYRTWSKVLKKSTKENADRVLYFKGERIFESFGLYTRSGRTRMFGLGIYNPQEGDDLSFIGECDKYVYTDYDFEGAPLAVMLGRDIEEGNRRPFVFEYEDGNKVVYIPVFSCTVKGKEVGAFRSSYGDFMVDVDI